MMKSFSVRSKGRSFSSAGKTILTAGFIAGALDMLAAIIVYSVIKGVTTDVGILKRIASAVFGKDALQGGTAMALYGLGFHFIIAFLFAIFYFLVFPYMPFLRKQKVISGLLYGIFVWCIMNLVVLRLLDIGKLPQKFDVIATGAIILMLFIGLPISLIVHQYYSRNGMSKTIG